MIKKRRSAGASLPSQEEILADYAKRLRMHRKGRRAAHIHLSRLSRASQHQQDLRIAAEAFLKLKRGYEGEIFRLANNDIVFIAKDVSMAAIDEVVLRLRYMFSDDAYFRQVEESSETDGFCTYYDMERDYEAFVAWATRPALNEDVDPASDSSVVPFTAAPAVAEKRSSPLPRHELQSEDVYAIDRDGGFAAILSEIRFRVSAMRARHGLPTSANMTDRWLLSTLANEMTAEFIADCFGGKPSTPRTLVLQLHPTTILLPEFDHFHDAYKRISRTPVLVEIPWQEALHEPETLIAARDRLARTGHKLCITDWDIYAFAMVDARRINAHFHKITWKQHLVNNFRDDWRQPIADAIRAAGPTKVILSASTSADSITFGQRLGLLLYSGSYPENQVRRA